MRTTRRPDSPPARPRSKNSSSSSPNLSRWSDESSSSSSTTSFERFDDAKEQSGMLGGQKNFTATAPKKLIDELVEERQGVSISVPEKLPGAIGLKRSPAVRLGVVGRKTPLQTFSQTAEVRGRGRTRAPEFFVEVLEFAKTKIHMIKTDAKGSYGEYYLGVDDKGRLVGVKELRSNYEVESLALEGKKANTFGTLRIHANREVNNTKRFVPQLEVRDLIVGRDKKLYLVMKPMAGTVDDLMYNIEPVHQKLMGRTVLCALAQHAAQIHRQGGLHGDMKTANALWSKEGLMVVADCGLSSRKPTQSVIRGTYFSPEMIEARAPYDHKADTWSLMVSLVTSYNPNGGDGAFSGKNLKEIRSNLVHFSAWRRHQLGGVLPELWQPYLQNNPFDKLFAPLFAADPILARYIIKHGLDPIAQERVSCEQIARDLSLFGHGAREQAEGLQMLASVPTDPMREQQERYLRNLVASETLFRARD